MKNFPSHREKNTFEYSDKLKEKIFEGFFGDKKFSFGKKLITRKEYLIKKGYFSLEQNDDDIKNKINNLFEEYEDLKEKRYHHIGYIKEDERSEKQTNNHNKALKNSNEINKILIFSGVAQLITAGDWSVNRIRKAEEIHGLQKNGFTKLQETLSNKYFDYSKGGKPKHLDKGGGNLALNKDLEKQRYLDSKLNDWEELSIGDHIFHPIESILLNNLKGEFKKNQTIIGFIHLLSNILKKLLKKRWYKINETKSSISDWESICPIHDLNDIYDEIKVIIENPSKIIELVYDSDKGEEKVSGTFEDEYIRGVRPDIQSIINYFLGKKDSYKYGIEKSNNSNETNADFLVKFLFKENFTESLSENKAEKDKKDLNLEADFIFDGYTQGLFTEIPKTYKDEEFLLITATRSDSHENNEDFEKDIRGNLNKLTPGGCLLTDGGKESFTAIHRFDIIEEILREKGGEYKAEIIHNNTLGKDCSVLIQRKHDKGFLEDEEKKNIFGEYISFIDIKEVKNTPYNFVINEVRKKILEITKIKKYNVDIFSNLQGFIKEEVINILEKELTTKIFESFESHIETIHIGFHSVLDIIEKHPEVFDLIKTYLLNDKDPKINEFEKELCQKGIKKDDIIILKDSLVYHEVPKLILAYENMIIKNGEIKEEIKEIDPSVDNILNKVFIYEGGLKGHLRKIIENEKDFSSLKENELEDIILEAEKKLDNKIKCLQISRLHTIIGGLKSVRPGDLNYFPRIGNVRSGNKAKIKSTELPKNDQLNNLISIKELEKSKKRIKEICERLKERSLDNNFKPICLCFYSENSLNELLLKKLNNVFGKEFVEENVDIIRFRYEESIKKIDSRSFKEFTETKFKLINDNGGIIIINGVLNVDKGYYAGFNNDIMDKVLPNIKERVGKTRLLNLGEVNNLRNKGGEDGIKNEEPVFEIGPTPINVVKKEHPILNGLPSQITLLLSSIQQKLPYNEYRKSMLESSLSGSPILDVVDYEYVSLNFLPYIDLRNMEDVEILLSEISKSEKLIKRYFGIGKEIIKQNLTELFDSTGIQRINGDAGEFLFIKSIEYLLEDII